MKVRVQRPINRRKKFKELVLSQVLRRQPIQFGLAKPMVSIIGDYISDRIRAEGLYERDILELLRDCVFDRQKCRDQVALDVGANIGNHSIFLAELFRKVIAFEPNPLTRSILQINIDLNQASNIDIRPVALSSNRGKETLHFAPANLGAAHLASVDVGGADRSAEVELAVGDEVIDRNEPIGFIKIDVEGAELSVLEGLEQTLRSHQPLVMLEQWPDAIDEKTGSSPSVSFLRELGYTLWQIRDGSAVGGRLGKLVALLRGSSDFELVEVDRLARRQYPALLFTPSGLSFS